MSEDADRLSLADVAALHEQLRGRNGWRGRRAFAAEIGEDESTLRRAMQRRRMRPATVDRLRAKISTFGTERSGVTLTVAERDALASLVDTAGQLAIARIVHVAPSTIAKATDGRQLRRASISRLRTGITTIARRCFSHTDCSERPTLGRACYAQRSPT